MRYSQNNNQPPSFNRFIAVDWSGARGPRLPGLQVACAKPGHGAPQLIPPVTGSPTWTRQEVLNWIIERARSDAPVLVGIDAAMAFPYVDQGAYFPNLPDSPASVRQLWNVVETTCAEAADFYAAPFAQTGTPFSAYFNAPGHRGALFDNQRGRLTELVCRKQWTRPSCVFNGVGAGSVGTGSLAAMRFARALARQRVVRTAVWPFQPIDGADLVLVEIFPRLYVKQAQINPQQWRQADFLMRVLRAYGCRAPRRQQPWTEDETDALLSAAAMRHHAAQPATWRPSAMTITAARREGWILGVC